MSSPLLDWLYPTTCALCKTPLRKGLNLCPACARSLPRPRPQACRICAQDFDGSISPPEGCPNCLALRPAFDFATAALRSSSDALNLVHQFKLLGRPELGPDLATLCAEAYQQSARLAALPDPILIPVPLHGSRLRSRGFNQAEELSRALSRITHLPQLSALKRIRSTNRQATLTRKQRLASLHKAFQTRVSPDQLVDRDLILIDDVFTTGSTAHECARALRAANPRSIAVLCVLRA